MLTGILGILSNGLRIVATWMDGYCQPKAVEARRLDDEKARQDAFDADLKLAAGGDAEAAARIRNGLHR